MSLPHLLLALSIVFIWGINFVVIKFGLQAMSPFALGVARFVLVAFPWIFFVRKPDAPLWLVALYGLLIFALQFGFLFTGMSIGMGAGLASLLLQLQVLFTIGFAIVLLHEKPSTWQICGAMLALTGVGVVALHVGGEVTVAGLVLLVLAAASWGGGNIVGRRISQVSGHADMLGLVVWGSLFAIPPLLAVSLLVDADGLVSSFTGLTWLTAGAVAYIVYLSTVFGFAAWGRLLALYPVATVAPFTLLVPVFGFLGAAILLGESLETWKLGASVLVIAGLAVNLFGRRLSSAIALRR